MESILLKFLQKIDEQGVHIDLFYEASKMRLPKPNQGIARKLQTKSLMNTDAKILTKILTNQSNKRITDHDQVESIKRR